MCLTISRGFIVFADTDVPAAVSMVKGKNIVLAWFGLEQPPLDHPMSDNGDIFLFHGHEEMTDLVWLKHIITKCGKGKKLELFSDRGMSQ